MLASSIDVGRRIAQHRRAQGISQKKLAKVTGLSIGTIYRVECGANSFWATVNVLREALGMRMEDLERDLVMGRLTDIHPGGSAEAQQAEREEVSKPIRPFNR